MGVFLACASIQVAPAPMPKQLHVCTTAQAQPSIARSLTWRRWQAWPLPNLPQLLSAACLPLRGSRWQQP